MTSEPNLTTASPIYQMISILFSLSAQLFVSFFDNPIGRRSQENTNRGE